MKLLREVRWDARCKWNESLRSMTFARKWDGDEVAGISYASEDEDFFRGIMLSRRDEVRRIFTHNFWRLEKKNYIRKYAKYLKPRGKA